jgi:3-isopropylmalate/(R)-2-methylmalate dehydratase small subunit
MPEPLKEVLGKACPLEADDVDTDQIFPAQFLKVIERRGLEKFLFYRLRYDEKGNVHGRFVLDRPEFRGARILVAGKNFGIGSSRENAVWALTDFGIRCVIASSFGDIFYNNASKNGLLCVRLPTQDALDLREKAASANLTLTVDLAGQKISDGKTTLAFEVEPYIKERLLKGMDDVAFTLKNYEAEIREYERKIPHFVIPPNPSSP